MLITIETLKEEVWKDIEGYEGMYQISSLGRVRSVRRSRTGPTGGVIKERVLKRCYNDAGYPHVTLSRDNIRKTKLVHRLVANHFITTKHKGLLIHHKDGDKTNNNITNLEFVTPKQHYDREPKMRAGLWIGAKYGRKYSKPIVQYTLEGERVAEYSGAYNAMKATGICSSCIGKVANNKKGFKTAGGFIWKYREQKVAAQ